MIQEIPPLVPASIRTARVASAIHRGPGLREIGFRLPDGPLLFAAGQWLAFQIAAGGVNDRGVWRVYSLCTAPRSQGEGAGDLEFGVLAAVDTNGPGGRRFAVLEPGDELAFHGPYGAFTLRSRPPREAVFAADGVGIGPVRGLLDQLYAGGPPSFPVTLLHQAAVPLALAFRREFEARTRQDAGFSYRPTVPGADSDWHGETLDLNELLQRRFPDARPGDGRHWYLCGSGRYTDFLAAWLRDRGVDGGSLRVERFFD